MAGTCVSSHWEGAAGAVRGGPARSPPLLRAQNSRHSVSEEVEMDRRRAWVRILALVALSVALLLGGTAAAQAWSNGEPDPNGYGTHDWMLETANALAADAGWVDLGVALPVNDDPDTVYNDVYYHIYDRWGNLQLGGAPTAVKYRYGLAVWYLRCGKVGAASKQIGLLAHYYGDLWNPFHSNFELSTLTANYAFHIKYEVDTLGHEDLVLPDPGYAHVNDAAAKTALAAKTSCDGFLPLIGAYSAWTGEGLPPGTEYPTQVLLTQAVYGLRDIIMSVAEDAGY